MLASARFPDPRTTVTDIVVVRSDRYTVDSTQFESFVRRLSGGSNTSVLAQAPTYLTDASPSLVSRDRHATMVPLDIEDDDEAESVVEGSRARRQLRGVRCLGDGREDARPRLQPPLTGGSRVRRAPVRASSGTHHPPARFRSGGGGTDPALDGDRLDHRGARLRFLLAQPFELSVFVINMLTGMGLALGIDYSLVVSRYREERAHGREQFEAIAFSGLTASRAVVFSGTAFVVAMFGMLLVPSSIMRSLAVGRSWSGSSRSSPQRPLPALLGLLGDRVDSLRVPFVGRRVLETAAPRAASGARSSVACSAVRGSAKLSTALLVALAAPAPGLNVGTERRHGSSRPLRLQAGFLALERDFPGTTTDPAEIVVSNASSPATEEALETLRTTLAADPRFGRGGDSTSSTAPWPSPLRAGSRRPFDENAVAAVKELRSDIVPATFAGIGAEVLVGGTTSENIDYFSSVIDPAPYVIGLVLPPTFVLLTVAFRSVVVGATAVVLNLLSVGAAYGLLVTVFQYGSRSGLAGLPAGGHDRGVGAAVPLLGALRPLDGLPGSPAQPDQGAIRRKR